jgi:hypothetical protein
MIGNDASDACSCGIRTKERAPREMHPAQGRETYRLHSQMLFTGDAKDHRERLWDRASEIATAPFAIFSPKKKLEVGPACRRRAGKFRETNHPWGEK